MFHHGWHTNANKASGLKSEEVRFIFNRCSIIKPRRCARAHEPPLHDSRTVKVCRPGLPVEGKGGVKVARASREDTVVPGPQGSATDHRVVPRTTGWCHGQQ
eukprot:2292845-Prymnesium_polylepis.1